MPLLTTGGSDPRAEVSGRVPESLPLGSPVLLPVALDNTSGSIINHLCVVVASDPAGSVIPVSAVFQGLETVTFSGDRACGGRLSGQEVINVVLTLRGARPGGAWLSLSPADGSRGIGPVLRRHVVVGG